MSPKSNLHPSNDFLLFWNKIGVYKNGGGVYPKTSQLLKKIQTLNIGGFLYKY